MLAYLGRRLLQLAAVVFGISTILFFLLRLSGDPVALLAGPTATREQVEELRRALGLSAPLSVQYLTFLGKLARLDFGTSLWYNEAALKVVAGHLMPTLQLALASMLFAVVLAFPIGIAIAVRRRAAASHLLAVLGLLGQTVPVFWLALLLILFFAVHLRWLPSFGYGRPEQFVLPTLALGALPLAKLMRLVRSGMLETLGEDFVRTARAKGLGERTVIYRHAARNMLIPVVTVIGLELGQLIGGAVITETVFTWPGIGYLLIQAVTQRDYPLVQAIVFVVAVGVVLINFAVDLFYRLVDPRVGYAG
ncbi:MAG: ABC transporter permease [Armatimonadetes bacterium]|nr:ABC transporter permease [Armatimonadota bacterium]